MKIKYVAAKLERIFVYFYSIFPRYGEQEIIVKILYQSLNCFQFNFYGNKWCCSRCIVWKPQENENLSLVEEKPKILFKKEKCPPNGRSFHYVFSENFACAKLNEISIMNFSTSTVIADAFFFCSALKTDVKARNLCNTFLISFFEEMKGNHEKEKSEISPNLKTSSIMCFRIKSDCVSGRKMCSLLMGWEHGKAKTKGKEKNQNGKCT